MSVLSDELLVMGITILILILYTPSCHTNLFNGYWYSSQQNPSLLYALLYMGSSNFYLNVIVDRLISTDSPWDRLES